MVHRLVANPSPPSPRFLDAWGPPDFFGPESVFNLLGRRDIYVHALAGNDANEGTKTDPLQTIEAGIALARSNKGDTVWVYGDDGATAATVISTEVSVLKSGIQIRNYGPGRMVFDVAGAEEHCLIVGDISTPVVDVAIIGAVFNNATLDNAAIHSVDADRVVFIDCDSIGSARNAFASYSTLPSIDDNKGNAYFFGCLADLEGAGNDAFNTKNRFRFYCFDCTALNATGGASTDAFTTHDQSGMIVVRAYIENCTKGGSFTHGHQGISAMLGCYMKNVEIGVNHTPSPGISSTDPADAAYNLAAFNVIDLSGNDVNSNPRGVAGSDGTYTDCFHNHVTVRSDPISSATRKWGIGTLDDEGFGRFMGNTVHLEDEGTETWGAWIGDTGRIELFDFNYYQVKPSFPSADTFRYFNSLQTWDEYRTNSKWEHNSGFLELDVSGNTSVSDQGARLGPNTEVPRAVPNLVTYLRTGGNNTPVPGIDVMALLRMLSPTRHENDVITDYGGGAISAASGDLFPGPWASDYPRTERVQSRASEDSGRLVIDGENLTANLVNLRINGTSILGDPSKRVRVKAGSFVQASAAAPTTVKVTSAESEGRCILASVGCSMTQAILPECVGRPGEDLFLSAVDSTGLLWASLDWAIENVGIVSAPVTFTDAV